MLSRLNQWPQKSYPSITRLMRGGFLIRASKGIASDGREGPFKSVLESNKHIDAIKSSFENLANTAYARLTPPIYNFSLIYDQITGRQTVRQAGIDLLQVRKLCPLYFCQHVRLKKILWSLSCDEGQARRNCLRSKRNEQKLTNSLILFPVLMKPFFLLLQKSMRFE